MVLQVNKKQAAILFLGGCRACPEGDVCSYARHHDNQEKKLHQEVGINIIKLLENKAKSSHSLL
ncbi:hypothetical protein D4R52_01195 [bacterium]|nr:MAG: hypothetical protein D4R52_01195 [bacterium]